MAPLFLLDSMLGSLARWLRIGGLDVEYRRDAADEDLLAETEGSGRVLLTRDEVLARRAKKRGVEVLLLRSQSDEAALREVVAAFGLRLNPEASRCPKCNGALRVASQEEVEARVPERTRSRVTEYWVCATCGGVYWRGSHWERITRTLNEAMRG